jgi:hypothetical protein
VELAEEGGGLRLAALVRPRPALICQVLWAVEPIERAADIAEGAARDDIVFAAP